MSQLLVEEFGSFLDRRIDAPPMVVEDLIAGGTITILGGQHKAGKTMLLGQLAMAVASGRPFLWWETTQSPVIYLNFEVAAWSIQRRFDRQLNGFAGVVDGDRRTLAEIRKNLHVVNLANWQLGRPGDLVALATEVALLEAKLVIVDPIRGCFRGDNNDDTAVNGVMIEILRRVVEPTGAAVVLGHHFRKPAPGTRLNGDTANVKGSGAWADAADAILTLSHVAGRDLERHLSATLRHFEGVQDAVVNFRPASMVYAPGTMPRRSVAGELAQAFRGSLEGELTMAQIGDALGIDRSRAQRRWSAGEWPQVREVRTGVKNKKWYVWEEIL